MTSAGARRTVREADPFAGFRNLGPAARADLALLGIASVERLAASDPDELYLDLQRITDTRQDPCVWDVFAAVVHQARTGEPLDWWAFTPERKARQSRGDFLIRRPARARGASSD